MSRRWTSPGVQVAVKRQPGTWKRGQAGTAARQQAAAGRELLMLDRNGKLSPERKESHVTRLAEPDALSYNHATS
jgi:hypothetical protein